MPFGAQIDASQTGFHPAIAKAASRTLHDAAQPLTVVQGLLELTLLQARSVEEYRESVEAALVEMARVGDCFDKVRQIVRLQQPANDITVFRLSDALTFALQELKSTAPDVEVVCVPPDAQAIVETSQGRLLHALSLMLSAAISTLNRDRKVCLSVERVGETFATRVETTATGPSSEPVTTAIELAQVVAASAGSKVEFIESPFAISLAIPKPVVDQSTGQKGTSNHV